jgi:DNA-binding NarL/FixJ family response regulator
MNDGEGRTRRTHYLATGTLAELPVCTLQPRHVAQGRRVPGLRRRHEQAPARAAVESQTGEGMTHQERFRLTEREQRIFGALITGSRKGAVARELGISPSLLTYGMRALFRKLGISSLVELGAHAQREGFIVTGGQGSQR